MSLSRLASLVLLVGVCAGAVSPAQSQDVTVGIRNGVVRSTVQGEVLYPLHLETEPVRQRMQTGFQVGGFLRLPLSERLGLQAELQYAQKGVALRGEYPRTCGGPLVDCIVPSLDGTYQLSYVQLPILLGWEFPIGHSVSIRAVAGPSPDLITSTSINTASLHPSALPENALTPQTKAQLGAVGGLAIQYDVPSGGAILLSARYHPAITEVTVIGSDATFRSRAYVFGLGYAFQL